MSGVQHTMSRHDSLPKTGLVLLAAISLFWGANWPGMKIVLAEIPVWWFRAMCVGVGGLGLLAIARASGSSLRVPRGEIGPLLLVSLFAMFGWQVLSAYGVSKMPAGRASIIAFTMPVWAAFLSYALLGEPITRFKVLGLLLGMTGLAILVGQDLMVFNKAPLGALFMLGAALSWGIGTVLFKKYRWTTPVAVLVGWQLAVSAMPITAVAMLFEPVPGLTHISAKALFALLYVFAFPIIFCHWAFFRVVSMFPATVAAMGTLAVPVIGVYSSALVLGEPVGWREFAALLLICAAMASVLVLPALKLKRA